MIRLRTLLLSNAFFLSILFIIFLYVGVHFAFIKRHTTISLEEKSFSGTIKEITYQEEEVKVKLKIKNEYILGSMDKGQFKYQLNDKVYVQGTLEKPKNNTIINGFNYRKYLYYNKTFYLMKIDQMKLIKKNKNIFYCIKNKIINKIKTYKSKVYLELFILGDKKEVDSSIYKTFQNNGISHLFCVSGMHVSLLTTMFLFLLKKAKVKELKRYIFLFLFLLFYLFLTNFSPSILRSVLFFVLVSINEYYYFHIKTMHLFLLTFCICLLINPYFLFHIGFLFSFTITFYLLLFSNYLNSKSKVKNLFFVSFVSFLASMPICVYNFYSINILSILYNLFFVPFISFLVFPLALLTFLFPILDSIFCIILSFMEQVSIFINQIHFLTFSFMKPNLFFVFLYYVVITICIFLFFHQKKKCFLILFFMLLVHFHFNTLFKSYYMIVIDVGQGESILLHAANKNILIDTGGKFFSSKSFIANNTVNMLKSLGIHKLDYLIITHGDYDHIGETIPILENIKVKKVLFNSNYYNTNEKRVIKTLNKKRIEYKKFEEGESLFLKNLKLYSINKDFEDENDSSLVLYVMINGYKLLLTGDASIKSEEYYINHYRLTLDFLKLGHHGSRTSTSSLLLEKTNPKFALISCGKDNKFKHPHEEIIERLNEYQIPYYRTDQDGSIKIDFKRKVTVQLFPA